MGCNCGKKLVYQVKAGNGETMQVQTLADAMAIIKRHGGTYQRVRL